MKTDSDESFVLDPSPFFVRENLYDTVSLIELPFFSLSLRTKRVLDQWY